MPTLLGVGPAALRAPDVVAVTRSQQNKEISAARLTPESPSSPKGLRAGCSPHGDRVKILRLPVFRWQGSRRRGPHTSPCSVLRHGLEGQHQPGTRRRSPQLSRPRLRSRWNGIEGCLRQLCWRPCCAGGPSNLLVDSTLRPGMSVVVGIDPSLREEARRSVS